MRKPVVCKFIRNFVTKAHISYAATVHMISYKMLHRNISVVQSLYFLNLKFQAPALLESGLFGYPEHRFSSDKLSAVINVSVNIMKL